MSRNILTMSENRPETNDFHHITRDEIRRNTKQHAAKMEAAAKANRQRYQDARDRRVLQAEWDRAGRHQAAVNLVWWIVSLVSMALIFWVHGASAAVGEPTVGAELIRAAQEQAAASMQQAWRQGSENDTQPVNKLVGNDGSVVLSQNAPRQIIMQPNGQPGLSDKRTYITVIQPNPTPVPTPRPRPTPLPTPKPISKARLQHDIHGDDFSASLTIPSDTGADALAVLQQESNNITDRYREKLNILNQNNTMTYNARVFELQTSRTVAVLWAIIPLLMTLSGCGMGIYWIVTAKSRDEMRRAERIVRKEG